MKKLNTFKNSIIILSLIVITFISVLCFCSCKKDNVNVNPTEYSINYIAEVGGYIEGETNQTVEYGNSTITVTAIPNEGYKFVEWSDGITNATRTELNVTSDMTVTAIFEKLTYFVIYETDGDGVIEGETNQTVEYGNSAITVTAVPNEGYKFVKWSDGVTTETRTETNVNSDITITATFEKLSYYVIYETDGNGTIYGESKQTVKYEENAITVAAIPNEGYKFVRWSDGITTATRTETNVTSDKMVTAIFDLLYLLAEYDAGSYGHIDGEARQLVAFGENATTIIAIPNEGYEFAMWSDGSTEAVRNDINIVNNISVSAFFRIKTFEIRYCVADNCGKILYLTSNKIHVNYGENGCIVSAVPFDGYKFIKWSDGLVNSERQELAVQSNIEVTAIFGCSVDYRVDGNKGGIISGDSCQVTPVNEKHNKVTAIADNGYVFCGWSDMQLSCEREDISDKCVEYVAYFEPMEKTFNYDYGFNRILLKQTSITIKRDSLSDVHFIVPACEGYNFCGWYIDNKYTTKIADEYGNLMLGYYTFALGTDTIYAKWQDDNTDKIVHKVLLVMVDEIQASLYSTQTDNMEFIYYKMSAIERYILSLIPIKVSEYLNDCFDIPIVFEVDTYFTTVPLNSDSFNYGVYGAHTNYSINTELIPDLGKFLSSYHNILTTFGLNDYSNNYHYGEGISRIKYANVNIEGLFPLYIINKIPLQDDYKELKSNNDYNSKIWTDMISTYIHEFTHSVEMYYGSELYEYHQALYLGGVLDITRKYLSGTLEVDGKTVGIPIEYWLHQIDVPVNYVVEKECYDWGKVILFNSNHFDKRYVVEKVAYGGEITVEAVPSEGHMFVAWSDGVTTAVRHDINIISYLTVEAIFI